MGFAAAYSLQMNQSSQSTNRRAFLKDASFLGIAGAGLATGSFFTPREAEAVGPVKLSLKVNSYTAKICPKDRPIPGEKAMKGMKGLCVTVNADVLDSSPKVRRMHDANRFLLELIYTAFFSDKGYPHK